MRAVAAFLALLLLALGGCATVLHELPDGVAVTIYQNRFDYSPRKLQIQVSNGSDAPITVIGASFTSTRFAEPAVWEREPREIAPGTALDLRVQLPDPVCPAQHRSESVTLRFALADGAERAVTVEPGDHEGWIDRINAQDCLAETVDAAATIRAPDHLEWMPGAAAPAVLEFTVEPTGESGALTLLQARGTVLLGLAGPDGAQVDALPLELIVDGHVAGMVIRIPFVPRRCDVHAVAEDKRGTFFPLDVRTAEGVEGIYYTSVSDAVRGEIYAYYGDYCELPGS